MRKLSISILFGSIINQQSDALVNAASTDGLPVNCWGGVAGAIRDNASTQSKILLYDDWDLYPKLKPGETRFVKKGDVPVKLVIDRKEHYLIHAGSYKKGVKDIGEKMYLLYLDIIMQVLDYNKYNRRSTIKSITIPPLGVGVYMVDPVISAQSLFRSLVHNFDDYFGVKKPMVIIAIYQGDIKGTNDYIFYNELLSLFGNIL